MQPEWRAEPGQGAREPETRASSLNLSLLLPIYLKPEFNSRFESSQFVGFGVKFGAGQFWRAIQFYFGRFVDLEIAELNLDDQNCLKERRSKKRAENNLKKK